MTRYPRFEIAQEHPVCSRGEIDDETPFAFLFRLPLYKGGVRRAPMSLKTKSEELFENYLNRNGLVFEKIEEDTSPRPDYLVHIGNLDLIFELKEFDMDENFDVIGDPSRPDIKSSSRTLGDHVRRRIDGSRKQIQYGTKQGIPSILLIYNSLAVRGRCQFFGFGMT